MLPSEEHLVMITGMSGAGKTVAAQSLEDVGYFCIDNLPPVLLVKLIELLKESPNPHRKIAFVIDLRGREFFSSLLDALETIEKDYGISSHMIFLEADDATLVRRYKETRRSHPLMPEGTPLEGIQKERRLLTDIKQRSHHVIDTSLMKTSQLRERIKQTISQLDAKGMPIQFLSFGFKYGLPIDADLVFDVRFLSNPYYIDSLRPQTGKDRDVQNYVLQQTSTEEFLERLQEMIQFLLPHYKREGKSQLVIGIGCTGGRHRSVTIAETLHATFKDQERCRIIHRDLEKGDDRSL